MPPHGMAVTGTDCTQMPGIGRTFSGYLSMITSSIRVACRNSQFRGTHKFLRGNDLVQCDVNTVRYSLFNFGVNKFIFGVNMYNLGVKVQPRCEPSNTCWQNNPVWSTFYGILHTALVWTNKYGMMVPCWCDTRYMVWFTTYSVNKMSMVWWASLVVWSTIYSFITRDGHRTKFQMVCSNIKWCDQTNVLK